MGLERDLRTASETEVRTSGLGQCSDKGEAGIRVTARSPVRFRVRVTVEFRKLFGFQLGSGSELGRGRVRPKLGSWLAVP